MATVEAVAEAHYRRQKTLARRAAERIARLWRSVDRANISQSWSLLSIQALTILASAQGLAAAASGDYVDAALDAQDLDTPTAGTVQPAAFAGVASDGRGLASLLQEPAIHALGGIGAGNSVAWSMGSGLLALDQIVRTQIADAGRVADGVAIAARPRVGGYVRMLSPPSCSRCIILAGKYFRWNAGFQRHPRCDCRHIPTSEDRAGDLRTDPRAAFDSMSAAEQDKAFGKAGAQAVRDGADIPQVTNARRGMTTASILGRDVLATTEGTTARGMAGRRLGARTPRLMPEQIYLEAAGNRDEAIRLLRRFGYIL